MDEARYRGPVGDRTRWHQDADLPIQGSAVVGMPVEELWRLFEDVAAWPRWNPCFWVARVRGGRLVTGATLVWAFNPIRRRYLYRFPAVARLVDVVPGERVTWEVGILPGFYARHTYWMERVDAGHARFGSWEVAEGPVFRLVRPFWMATFRYVRRASLLGARRAGRRRSAA